MIHYSQPDCFRNAFSNETGPMKTLAPFCNHVELSWRRGQGGGVVWAGILGGEHPCDKPACVWESCGCGLGSLALFLTLSLPGWWGIRACFQQKESGGLQWQALGVLVVFCVDQRPESQRRLLDALVPQKAQGSLHNPKGKPLNQLRLNFLPPFWRASSFEFKLI